MSYKKCIVSCEGGLGNIMFRICSGYSFAMKQKKDLYLIYSMDGYHHTEDYSKSILKKFSFASNVDPSICMIQENDFNCYKYIEYPYVDSDVLFYGYFQNEKYFKDYRENILEIFAIEDDRLSYINNKYPRLGSSYFIHVRRGDYLEYECFNFSLIDYYTKALEYIHSKDPTAYFYIFSDDLDYCRKLFAGSSCQFVDENEINSLYMMSLCSKGGICANSSFSWWGSYLNPNPEKIVVFPRKWVNKDRYTDIQYSGSIILDI